MTEMGWAIAALTVTAVSAVWFLVVYGVFAKWYRSLIGRALWLSELSLAGLIIPSLLAYWFHFTLGIVASLTILWFIAVTAVLRAWMVTYEQMWKRWRSRRSS